MTYYFAGIIVGLALIVVSADKFVVGTVAIARYLGVSPLVIGLTVVGFGTSAPEILVSAIASIQGNTGLAIGNALGSNIANIGLVLGCAAILFPISVRSQILKRELPVLMGTTMLCFVLALKGDLSRIDGLAMLFGLVVFLFWLVKTAKSAHQDTLSAEVEQELPKELSIAKAFGWFAVGLVGLLVSSRLLVWAAVHIAEAFGVSDLVIGLTIVAIGTSLPELAASIASILKKEHDLAIGNVIGSNMFNLLAVYSLPGIFHPGPLDSNIVIRDFPWVIGFTVALFILGFGRKESGSINRCEGGFLLVAFIGYQTLVFISTRT